MNDLQQVGAWMKVNGEAIYGTKPVNSWIKTEPAWGRVTQNGCDFYLHVFDWPKDSKLIVPDIGKTSALLNASLLSDKDRKFLKLNQNAQSGTGTIGLPLQPPDPIDTVVGLTL